MDTSLSVSELCLLFLRVEVMLGAGGVHGCRIVVVGPLCFVLYCSVGGSALVTNGLRSASGTNPTYVYLTPDIDE